MAESLQFKCPVCPYSCLSKSGLNKHKRTKHPSEEGPKLTILCPSDNCEAKFKDHDAMVAHVNDVHLRIEMVTKELINMNAFEKYLEEEERQNVCKFVKYKESTYLKIYNCSRTGQPRGKATEDRQNARSNLTTKKIGVNCTARITAKIDKLSSAVSVKYSKTHFGHECDPHMIPLLSDQKAEITRLLATGLTPVQIHKQLSRSPDPAFQALNKHDIYNLKPKVSFSEALAKIKQNPLCKHLSKLYKDHRAASEEDFFCVFFSEYQKDTRKALINDRTRPTTVCFDATHIKISGINHSEFKLISLVTLDSFGEGFPCAFCVCKSESAESVIRFLSIVKDHFGVLHATYLMSEASAGRE